MSEYIVELDSKHSIALKLALAEEMRGGDFIRGEIVRCKDCKYYMPTMYTPFSNEALCYGLHMEEDWGMVIVKPDGFCAWGERKQ